MTIPDLNPLGYTGLKQLNPPNIHYQASVPTPFDIVGFDIGDIWINTTPPTTAYMLASKSAGIQGGRQTGTWSLLIGPSGDVSQLTTDAGVVQPIAGNINVNGGTAISTKLNGAGNLQINASLATTTTVGVASFPSTSFSVSGAGAVSPVAATYSTLGVASFNQDEFTVSSGAVQLYGGLVLIASVPVVNNIVVFDNVTYPALNNYNSFFLNIRKTVPVNNADQMVMDTSTDSGVHWQNSGYLSGVVYTAYNSTGPVVWNNMNLTTRFVLSGNIDSSSQYNASLYISNMNSADYFSVNGTGNWEDTVVGPTECFGTIAGLGNTGVNTFRLGMNSGNISKGTFSLYGIKES
jgi:hypothetical protein